MQGDLRFSAAHALQRPCVSVERNASVVGNVHFQNCHNENEKAEELYYLFPSHHNKGQGFVTARKGPVESTEQSVKHYIMRMLMLR